MSLNADFRTIGYLPILVINPLEEVFIKDVVWIRIKEIALDIFTKLDGWVETARAWGQASLITFAIIGCVCLIVLIAIGIFKKPSHVNTPPQTPPIENQTPEEGEIDDAIPVTQ